MKAQFKQAYMKAAEIFADLSHARRLHVGAIIVKDDRIISIGYNGMPAGWDNNCEDKDYMSSDAGGWLNPDEIEEQWPLEELVHEPQSDDTVWTHTRRYRLKTKSEVLHAETNCIAKLARSSDSGLGADMFITHAPCLDCAKLIYQSGIKRVWYGSQYRDSTGTEFLRKSGVEIEQLDA
jgi:dCMP deaminase